MSKFLMAAISVAILFPALPAVAGIQANEIQILSINEFAHGGGCRRSSPAGQCCHMETAVGVVHCH